MTTKLLKHDSEFITMHPLKNFLPIAYYDKDMDCIRVQIKDCSFTEIRENLIFTLYQENHTTRQEYVGFTIKGINYLLTILNIPVTPIKIAKLLNEIVRVMPEQTIKDFVDTIKSDLKTSLNLKVDLAA